MSSVVISGDTSGSITLAAPAVSGTNTATLPAATGTVMVSGNMPAFAAYMGSQQSIANNTQTKVAFNTKNYDTNTNYSTSTYLFTPTVAGYYQVNAQVGFDSGTAIQVNMYIFKNSSSIANFRSFPPASNAAFVGGSSVVYCNGSTDTISIYCDQASGLALNTNANTDRCFFNATMIRSA